MSPAARAPALPITIVTPSADGANFDGTADGRVSPADSRVSAKFWPGGNGVGTAVDGVVTVTSVKWSATFDMSRVGPTTTGFLSVTNDDVGAEAHRSALVWAPVAAGPATTATTAAAV
jgi:hypothetical protein